MIEKSTQREKGRETNSIHIFKLFKVVGRSEYI